MKHNKIAYYIKYKKFFKKKNRTEFVPVTKSGPKKTALTCQKKILKQSAPTIVLYHVTIKLYFKKISEKKISEKEICTSKCLCITKECFHSVGINKRFFFLLLSPLPSHFYTVFPGLSYYH